MSWYNANLKKINCYSRHKHAMLKDLQELYKKYLLGELGGTQQEPDIVPVSCESTFCDNFESEWFSLNTYVLQFGETFNNQWFTDNNYLNEYKDEFDAQWFIDNNYTNQWNEDFESGDWDE